MSSPFCNANKALNAPSAISTEGKEVPGNPIAGSGMRRRVTLRCGRSVGQTRIIAIPHLAISPIEGSCSRPSICAMTGLAVANRAVKAAVPNNGRPSNAASERAVSLCPRGRNASKWMRSRTGLTAPLIA